MSGNRLVWNRAETPAEINRMLSVLAEEYPVADCGDGMRIRFEKIAEPGVLRMAAEPGTIVIQYGSLQAAARGVGNALAGRTVSGDMVFKTLGIMLDCSRNAVMKVSYLKKWLRRLTLLGYNMVMLYTEDTYQLPEEPYFGYLRGGYSLEEMREIDAYASGLGIEMIGCIQTLGHLEHIIRWHAFPNDSERVLLVDDDASMRLLTTARLKHQFTVIPARDGVEALEVLARQPADLIIADVMMPRMDGYTLVKTLRERGDQIPVLLLTAKQSFEDKREGFSSGIDDYMTKPVNYEELVWRLNALLRRSRIASERRIVVGPVVLDSSTYTVTREGEALELPKKEFELLYRLLSYPGQIFTRNQLLDGIWGYASESGEDTVKTHISRLRNKLRHIPEFRIVTIKGLGYKAEITKGETP